jgi:hypothetical protein
MNDLSRFCSLYASLGCDLHVDLKLDLPLLSKWESSEGLLQVVRRLSSLGRCVEQGLISGQFIPPSDLRHDGYLPFLLRKPLKKVFSSEGRLDTHAHPDDVRSLRQLTQLLGKINMPCSMTPKQAWIGFKERQERLARFKLPSSHPVLIRARELAHHHLQYLDLDDITPGHGPGAVAEGYARDERYILDPWFSTLENMYPRDLYGRRAYGSTAGPVSIGKATTRVVTVPKDYRKLRLISVEPASQQFIQQGQMKAIYKFLDRSPLGLFCSVDDQERNRTMTHREFTTLDLSDASDNLSIDLVANIIPFGIYRRLVSSRSQFAAFEGETIRLNCFSPMGSAVCFPLQTIIFTLLCMATWDYLWPENELRDLRMSCFGDDIIVPSELHSPLAGVLSELGLIVNHEKSCYLTPFRESCGLETWKDVDVSIVKCRDYYFESPCHRNLVQILALQRNLFQKGYAISAENLFRLCRTVFPVPRTPNVNSDCGFALGSPNFFGCRMRYNKNYQRTEVLVPTIRRECRNWKASLSEHRLFARLIGDSLERVPTRGLTTQFGWRSDFEMI